MKLRATKVREITLKVSVILALIVLAAIANGVFGWKVPVLRQMAELMGFD